MAEKKSKVYRCAVVFLSVSLAGLSACKQTGKVDTAIHYHSYDAKSNKDEKNPFIAVVKKGDTLYDLAQEHGANLRGLIELNQLKPPYKLSVGQRIRLPKPVYHMVKEQDTLYAISRSYDIDMSSLIQANNLQKPYTLYAGEKLRMPSRTDIRVEEEIYEPVDVAESDEVKKAAPYGVKSNNLAAAPRASSNFEPIQISSKPSVLGQQNNTAKSTTIARARPVPSLKRRSSSSILTKSSKVASSSQKVNFYWPVRGKVISRFGPKNGGLYNDGINIRASEGTPIKAAADGKVVYAGNELKGYGNLLLIKHGNGFLTAYAHTQRNVVAKGDHVSHGQLIAYVGKTGHVKESQLHFSIRQGRKAFDPEKFLVSSYSMR